MTFTNKMKYLKLYLNSRSSTLYNTFSMKATATVLDIPLYGIILYYIIFYNIKLYFIIITNVKRLKTKLN